MKKNIKSFLSSIDQFSNPNNLRFDSYQNYSTKAGVTFTLFVIILTCASFCYLLNDLFSRENPSVFQKSEQVTKFDPIVYGPQNFFISVIVTNASSVVVNQPSKIYYTVSYTYLQDKLQVINGTSNYVQTVNQLTAGNCDPDKINKKLIQNIDPYALRLGYCPNPEAWTKLNTSFYGTELSSEFSVFIVNVEKCVNSTANNNTCATASEISSIQSIIISTTDFTVDQTLVGNPYSPIIRLQTFDVTYNKSYQAQNNYKTVSTETTENFFYYFGEQYTFSTLQLNLREVKTQITNNQQFVSVTLVLTSDSDITFRNYSNILNIFGDIAGLFRTLTLLISLIMKPLVVLYHQYEMLNVWFYYKNPKNLNKKQLGQTNNISQSHNEDAASKKLLQLNDELPRDILEQGMDEVYKQMDIKTYLLKLQEIENLKEILFSEEQRTLMTFMMKPELIKIKNRNISKSIELPQQLSTANNETDREKPLINLVNCYRKVSNDVENNPINQNILKKIYPAITTMLEDAIILERFEVSQMLGETSQIRGENAVQPPRFKFAFPSRSKKLLKL